MASVALAGRPRVNDNLQTRPTVYKSGTLVESTLPAFFCQTPDASLNHWLGLSSHFIFPHHFAKRNGSRKPFSNTQCLVCISDAFWKSVSPCHDMCVHKIMNMYIHGMYMVQTCMYRFAHSCGGGRIPDVWQDITC